MVSVAVVAFSASWVGLFCAWYSFAGFSRHFGYEILVQELGVSNISESPFRPRVSDGISDVCVGGFLHSDVHLDCTLDLFAVMGRQTLKRFVILVLCLVKLFVRNVLTCSTK